MKTLGSIVLFCILLIVSKEFLFLNEEVLVIISFLTVVTLAIKVGGESIGEELDKVSVELSTKLNEQQKQLSGELEATRTGVKGVETVQGELDLLISYSLEQIEKLEVNLIEENWKKLESLIDEQISAAIEKEMDEEIARMEDMVEELFEEHEETV